MFWYNLPIDNAVPERVTFLVTTSLFKQQQKIGGLENFDKRPSKIEILISRKMGNTLYSYAEGKFLASMPFVAVPSKF